MERSEVLTLIQSVFSDCPGNTMEAVEGISPALVGQPIFDAPLIGFASAEDPLFEAFLASEVIGPWHKRPVDWLPEAATVISLFLPLAEAIRTANRKAREMPSLPWLYGRIEGQAFISTFTARLQNTLRAQGAAVCVPALDSRFSCVEGGAAAGDIPEGAFSSNWSERHAAYTCGLGTFGLSKGLITEKGMAGRLCSLITDLQLEPTKREYSGLYDYCTMCGACVRRCPMDTISLKEGKKHPKCREQMDLIRQQFAPRFGCGLCQTGVPCESRIPTGKR